MILIIGGNGFIGNYLRNKFKQAYIFDKNIQGLVQNFTQGDIRFINDLNKIPKNLNFESIYLLAAEHKDDVNPVSLYYDVNVNGTENVLSFAKERAIYKIIFTSSVAVYGLNKNNPDENSILDPFNHYGKSKLLAEDKLITWCKSSQNHELVVIRPTVVFGINNRGNVYNLFKQISTRKFIMIGDGENKKSMCYVENLVDFLYYFTQIKDYGVHIYNYADKPDLNTKDLVKIIYSILNIKQNNLKIPYKIAILISYLFDFLAYLTNKKFPISKIRIQKFCATTQFNSNKVFELNFTPKYTIFDGIKKTIETEFKN
jgi:nucleoside-diphosphate-sugar epimerase